MTVAFDNGLKSQMVIHQSSKDQFLQFKDTESNIQLTVTGKSTSDIRQ